MILASHIIIGAYGFWLPNDPRGSWSDFVGSYELHRYGRATKTDARRSVAGKRHDATARKAAKGALKRPPIFFTGIQAREIARGFASYAREAELRIFACAVLPDHMHLVLGRHRLEVEQLAIQPKAAATRSIKAAGLECPHRPFARGEWKVYLETPADIRRAIRYVENNPLKENKPRQRWSFISPYLVHSV